MGVPKFYRWISERYPSLSAVVKEFQLPEFDNLYLDMNGIVHTCSHPEDNNPHFRITEEQIFRDICHYIEFLFRMIKPRKVFFMAIDGVAPRAKMNQQRGRRFRSAREAEELIKQALDKGEQLPTEKRFDSNCITPGTPFMKRLQDHLKYFAVNKVSTDPLWQGPKIILSGHETPGEGEHKVMDFIRFSRSQPDYDHNTRHCLYGLDADLIMLGLATHEPHFSLLREEVRFGGKKDANKRPATPEETTFHLLHLSLLRDYLDCEFSLLKKTLPFPYSLESIIDDWILMGFLVGNDFIPHLPNLHIQHDALPLLWQTYMNILPSLDGYLHDGGHLNLKRFEKYLGSLAQTDRDKFGSDYMDMKYLAGKRADSSVGKEASKSSVNGPGRPRNKTGGDNAFAALEGLDDMDVEFDEDGKENGQLEAHLQSQGMDTGADFMDSDEDCDTFEEEFSLHKRNYYMTHMHYDTVTTEVLREQAYEYVRGIQWILLYYFDGVQSWSWFYPFHYAPYVSDVHDFSDMDMDFDMSEPFKPFEQLMAVLPAASKELLPEPFQELMTSDTSPIVEFYPPNFETDLNGKQQPWEAVVLIPFIDERRLLEAMRTKEYMLTPEEVRRNSHGPSYMYQYSAERQGFYPSPMPREFPDVVVNHAKICEVPKFQFCLEPSRICKGLLSNTSLDVYYAGFPNLNIIPFDDGVSAHWQTIHTTSHQLEPSQEDDSQSMPLKAHTQSLSTSEVLKCVRHQLEKCGVKVFHMNSRGFNMMLKIREQPERRLEDIADSLLGKTTWVGWPHMQEAKVYAVADERFRIEIEEHHKKGHGAPVVQWKRHELKDDEVSVLYREASSIREKYETRYGIKVGKTTVLIYAGLMTGRKYVYTSQGKVTAEKQFSSNHTPFALQATRQDILVHAPEDMHFHTMEELFHKGAAVFMLGNPHYGCQGEVLEVNNKEGRVRVSFTVLQEPDLTQAFHRLQLDYLRYVPGHIAAQRTGLNHGMLSRITGTVLILQGDGGNPDSKVNIGLNLKFTKRGEEVPGYTKKTDEGWLYSEKCIEVVSDYVREFAELWDYIASSRTGNSDIYTEVELFPEESEKKLKDVKNYLKELPCMQIKPIKSGSDIVEDNTIADIEAAVDKVWEVNKNKRKKVTMQVKPHLLYRPLPNQGTLEPDPGTRFEQFDRVVAVKMGYSVPFGLRGTIVGIHPGETEADTLYDVIFDQEFPGGILLRSTTKRGYRVPAVAMLSLTHDARKSGHQQLQQHKPSAMGARNAWTQPLMPGYGYQGNRPFNQGQGSYSRLLRQEGARQGDFGIYHRQDQWSGHNSHGMRPSQPQFVTPRLLAPRTAHQEFPVKPTVPAADNSDFTSIWNQLQQSNVASSTASNKMAPSSTTSQKGAGSFGSPIFGSASLKTAAEKLGKIPLPSPDLMEVEQPKNPPTGILVDLSDMDSSGQTGDKSQQHKSQGPSTQQGKKSAVHKEETKTVKTRIITNSSHRHAKADEDSSSSSKSSTSVLALFEKANKAREEQQKSPAQSVQTDKVQALFDQVQKPTSITDDASSNEFNALFAALKAAPKSVSPSNLGPASQSSATDGSAALKQMLKIGMEDTASNEQTNKKSYGKQVSVQELFDVAKQAPQTETAVSAAAESHPAFQTSTTQQSQKKQPEQPQQHHEQQHQFQQPVRSVQSMPNTFGPAPSLLGNPVVQGRNVTRKPIDELAAFCQSLGQHLPKYDFNYQHKQKGYICQVTLPTGARFEGSLTHSQQDAAESAASVALLCVRQAQVFPGQRGGMWIQQPGARMAPLRPGQRLFSPNSAFSPVPTPLMRFNPAMFNQPPPGLLLHPGQRGRQPLLSQPPMPFPNRGTHPNTQPPPVALAAFHQNAAHRTVSQIARPQLASQGVSSSEPRHPVVRQGVHDKDVSPSESRHPQAMSDKEATSQSTEEKGKEVHEQNIEEKGREDSGKSSTEAFIPLQVTRLQRRKEENPDKQPSLKVTETVDGHHQSVPHSSLHGEESHSKSPAAPTQELVNSSVQDEVGSVRNGPASSKSSSHVGNTEKTPSVSKESDSVSGKPAAKEEGAAGSGKKRRPRIAANFAVCPK